jgi:hypothetical protein
MTGGIDRVGGFGAAGEAVPVGRGRVAGAGGAGGAFRVAEGASEPAAASGIGASEAAALLGVMLTFQEVGPERPRDRAARLHGEAILAELRGLQLALLGEDGGEAALARLGALVGRLPEAGDPELAASLAWLAVRARIELARRQGDAEGGETKTA